MDKKEASSHPPKSPKAKEAIAWQRRLDPSHFQKATGAKFKTAPTVLMPDSSDCFPDAPDNAVHILFFIDGETWVGDREKVTSDSIEWNLEEGATKAAKFPPISVWEGPMPRMIVRHKESFYFGAYVAATHEVFRTELRPSTKKNDKGKWGQTTCVVAFIPNGDE